MKVFHKIIVKWVFQILIQELWTNVLKFGRLAYFKEK